METVKVTSPSATLKSGWKLRNKILICKSQLLSGQSPSRNEHI